MIDRNNTSTKGYILCSDCKFGVPVNDNEYVCFRIDKSFLNVGVCRDFVKKEKRT